MRRPKSKNLNTYIVSYASNSTMATPLQQKKNRQYAPKRGLGETLHGLAVTYCQLKSTTCQTDRGIAT